jgi:DNA polymerase I-like protein with 3'-5' exonuclease and polymerase domains
MIYLVTGNLELFVSSEYRIITPEKSLEILNSWSMFQYDSETTGRDCHVNDLLCAQFGNVEGTIQIVVDTTTVDIRLYKEYIENHYMIGQNLKFDIQFLYNYGIIPRRVYDTMIVEQMLHLGYPSGMISYALNAIAKRRLGIDIDKSVRGEIIWRGLDTSVIKYAAGDVTYLGDIMKSQLKDCKEKECTLGAKLECDFVPAISYLEWCGIKLDESKWKEKMVKDNENLSNAEKALNDFTVNTPLLEQFTYIERQGSLFDGFDLTPKVNINWSSSQQVIKVAKILGFDTKIQDKKTGEDKDSVLEKYLKAQKGINDEFLKLYFNYQEYAKVCSTYGQGHLDCVNPNTGRIHTVFKQLGASSGRMSCGSNQPNTDLAKLKKIPASRVKYPNIQQLPANEETRSSFVSEKGNLFVSCDYSAMESYLGADIYDDKEFQNEFLYGSKDTHSLFAWMVFRKECEELGCTCVADVKKKAPQWRKAVKAVEFAYMFGAAAPTIAQSAGCSEEQAQEYIDRLNKGFKGISRFASEGSKFVRKNGYIVINKFTGHKLWWWDHDKWLERQKRFNEPGFWDVYKQKHKGTGDAIAMEVREHFQAASKYDRLARNCPTQGSGACITKLACINLFNWIIDNSYFNQVKLVAIVHDEICCEYPENLKEFPKVLESIMEEASAHYCKFSRIPAEASVGTHWIH